MKRIIIGLLCFNFGLALYLGYASLSRPTVPRETLSPGQPDSGPDPTPRATARRQTSKHSSSRGFDWQSVASPDLRQYIANLRAVQCPEETIRDIILAEANRQYAPR